MLLWVEGECPFTLFLLLYSCEKAYSLSEVFTLLFFLVVFKFSLYLSWSLFSRLSLASFNFFSLSIKILLSSSRLFFLLSIRLILFFCWMSSKFSSALSFLYSLFSSSSFYFFLTSYLSSLILFESSFFFLRICFPNKFYCSWWIRWTKSLAFLQSWT